MSRLTDIERLLKYAPAQDGEVRVWKDTHRHMRISPGVWRDLDTGEITDDEGNKIKDDPREKKPRGVFRTQYEKVMNEPPSFVGKHELWNEVCSRVQKDGELSYGDAVAEYAKTLSNRLEGRELPKEWSSSGDEENFNETYKLFADNSMLGLKIGSEKFMDDVSKIDFRGGIRSADFGEYTDRFLSPGMRGLGLYTHPYVKNGEGTTLEELFDPSFSIVEAMMPRINEDFRKIDFDSLASVKDYFNTCKYNRIGMTELSAFQFYRGYREYGKINSMLKEYSGDLEALSTDLSIDTGESNPHSSLAACLSGMSSLLSKLPRYKGKTNRTVNIYSPDKEDAAIPILSKFKEGSLVKFNTFISAGKSKRLNFNSELKSKKSNYQRVHFEIDSYSAPDASMFSQMYGECIYHPSQQFLVNEIAHSTKTGVYTVRLLQYGGAD